MELIMIKILEQAKRLSQMKQNQTLPSYRRYLYNDIVNSTSKIVGIYGSRGVGKTTVLMQLLKSSKITSSKKMYISFDHPIFQDVSLFDFVEEFVKRGGQFLVIDEVHDAKDFQNHLKSIYDFLDVKVYFSGSSAIEITNADLARRYSMYHLSILSFKEYIEFTSKLSLNYYSIEEIVENHEDIAAGILSSLKDDKILRYFDEFKDIGAYPFYFEDKTKYFDRINETINIILHTDLGKIFNIKPDKIDTLKKLLMTISVSKPLELSIEKLSSTVGITKTTLYKYIEYLSRAELINHISHEAKRFKSIRKPDKLYLANTNLFGALCLHSETGTLRETFFASMVGENHTLNYVDRGDFLVDDKYTFEFGGSKKSFDQIKGIENSYVVSDEIEIGFANRIPLWLFGFIK